MSDDHHDDDFQNKNVGLVAGIIGAVILTLGLLGTYISMG